LRSENLLDHLVLDQTGEQRQYVFDSLADLDGWNPVSEEMGNSSAARIHYFSAGEQ